MQLDESAQTGMDASEETLRVQLQHLIQAIDASGQAVLPRADVLLLQSIVEAAARIFGAVAAAIALITEDGEELEFKVAYNVINQNIIGMRFPVTQGIAGYVAMTGQPLAIGNVAEDGRFNRQFAQQSGYIPKTILAVPLISGERVMGVMEVLDKISGESFTLQDMELLAIFAGQAAIAIHQAQQIAQLEQALRNGLKRITVMESARPASELLEALEEQPHSSQELVRLAELIHEISAMGQAEQLACLRILSTFQSYSRSKKIKTFRS